MPTSSLVTFLVSNELFKTLDEATLRALEEELDLVHLAPDEILFRQGDPGDSMCVLIPGRLVVRLQHARGEEMIIGEEAGPGVSVDEMSLVTGQARAATVYALS